MVDPQRYGPWAVVAGGSEGVGAEVACQLADSGISSVLVARRPEPLAETAAAVRERGVQVRELALDLTAPDVTEQLRQVTDDLDVGLLVYNAGANSYGHEYVTGDLDGFQRVVDLNITTQMALTHHYGGRLAERGRGGILLMGSMAGFLGKAEIGVYAAAKSFGRIFAEGLWLELGRHGVDVLELVLGVTRTPAMARAGIDVDASGAPVAEPADVAAEGLAHLGDGPVRIMPGNEKMAARQNGEDRARLVTKADEMTRRLTPDKEEDKIR